jgi:hypothetical protein
LIDYITFLANKHGLGLNKQEELASSKLAILQKESEAVLNWPQTSKHLQAEYFYLLLSNLPMK